MIDPLSETDLQQRRERAAPALWSGNAGIGQRQLDVGERSGSRDEVETLKHETDIPVADVGQGVFVDPADVAAGQPVAAAGRQSRQPMMFIKVLLPLPNAPTTATYSPRSTRKLIPRSACTETSPIRYVFRTSRRSITGAAIALPSPRGTRRPGIPRHPGTRCHPIRRHSIRRCRRREFRTSRCCRRTNSTS